VNPLRLLQLLKTIQTWWIDVTAAGVTQTI